MTILDELFGDNMKKKQNEYKYEVIELCQEYIFEDMDEPIDEVWVNVWIHKSGDRDRKWVEIPNSLTFNTKSEIDDFIKLLHKAKTYLPK